MKRVKLALLLLMLLTLLSSSAYNSMHREDQPQVSLKTITVGVTYPGASPQEVDKQIIDILEPSIRNVSGIQTYSASAMESYGLITLEFNMQVDEDEKLKDVEDAVNAAASNLPEDAQSPVVSIASIEDTTAVIAYLSGPQSLDALQSVAEDLQNDLEDLDGVETVDVYGGLEDQIIIEFDPTQLQLAGVSFTSFERIIENTFSTTPLGTKEIGNLNVRVRTAARDASLDEIKNIELTSNSGTVYLSDVADIYIEKNYLEGENYISGSDDTMHAALKLVVNAAEDADISKTASTARTYLDEAAISLENSQIQLDIFKDRGVEVEFKLQEVLNNASSGLAIVIVVLFIFIGLRESFIASLAIPISLMISIFAMNALDMTFNTISLAALIISLGMLVDSTIVVIENIVDKMKHSGNLDDSILEGTNQVALAVFAATMTTVSAFVPLLQPAGILGEFLKVLPQTVIIAILSSFVTSVLFTPALCKVFMHTGAVKNEPTKLAKQLSVAAVAILSLFAFRVSGEIRLVTFIATLLFTGIMYYKLFKAERGSEKGLKRHYVQFMTALLKSRAKRIIVVVVAFAVLLSAFMLVATGIVGIQMMPSTDETNYEISVQLPAEQTRAATNEILQRVQVVLAAHDEIKNYVFDLNDGDNEANIGFNLVNKDQRSLHSTEFTELLSTELQSIPGADFDISLTTLSPQNSSTIDIKLTSDDRSELTQVYSAFAEAAHEIEGIQSVTSDYMDGPQEVIIDLNSNKIEALGLNESTISETINSMLFETILDTEIVEDTDIVLRPADSRSSDIEQLKMLPVSVSGDSIIQLGTIAELKVQQGASEILRENGDYQVNMSFSYTPQADSAQLYSALTDLFHENYGDSDVSLSVGGTMEDLQESFDELKRNMILAVFLVYMVLAFQFNSFTQPFVILLSVPFGVAGACFGLAIMGKTFGLFAFIGLISLVGIVVNDSIVLIEFANQNKNKMSTDEALLSACESRMIPVFVATMTTVGGILPLAIGSEFYSEIGYTLVFGLSIATLLTLILIPIFYKELDVATELVTKLVNQFKTAQDTKEGEVEYANH